MTTRSPRSPPFGTFCWEPLNSTDPAKAAAFWAAVVRWTSGVFAPGIPTFDAASGPVADVSETREGAPSHWLGHVAVADLDAAMERVTRAEGTLLSPAIPVPGVGRMTVIRDPQGAVLSLFQAE